MLTMSSGRQCCCAPRVVGVLVWAVVCLSVLGGLASSPAWAEAPYTVNWSRQIGTNGFDESYGVAVDGSGNAYISGYTNGSLGGANAGGDDAFLTKYDSSGTLLWSRQIGTTARDESYGVAVDGLGNAYISGFTLGSLGGASAGGADAFLTKYDSSGTLLWSRQIGTASNDYSSAVAVDGSGNAYIGGFTLGSLDGANAGGMDVFLTKYDASGTLLWTRQFGTTNNEDSWGVAVDGSGNAYISGSTFGSLGDPNAGGADAFLTKYDSSGTLLWSTQIGSTSNDFNYRVAVDGSGNAYISGFTFGSLGGANAGDADAFLIKYDSSGTLLWSRQIGTNENDESYGVAVDGSDNAYIGGATYGSLGGPNLGYYEYDVFLTKYDSSGTLLWSTQTGTMGGEAGIAGVAVDGSGNAYIGGYTDSSFGGPNAGFTDALLIKFSPVEIPEPASLTLLGAGGLLLLRRRRA